jgi:3-phosphoshikimate 1-carboxyvinyltransferase
MDITVNSTNGFYGEIHVPPSKSYGQRALAASLLIPRLEISNLGNSADELAALKILQSLGKSIEWKSDTKLVLDSNFDFRSDVDIFCGESGLCARLFSGLMMLNLGKTIITGDGSLAMRPMNSIFSIYNQLGLEFYSHQDRLPLTLTGNRQAIDLEIDGSISSQSISGVLFYLVGLKSMEALCLKISNLTSRPYIDMTIETLTSIGANIKWSGDNLLIHPTVLQESSHLSVEADWSSASFWIVAAAIYGQIKLTGLNPNSIQADRAVLDIVEQYGAEIVWENENLTIHSKNHRPFNLDLKNNPDLAPIIAVLAIFADGESVFQGVDRLKYKESDRLNSILNWLIVLNISYKLKGDSLHIFGSFDAKLKMNNTINLEFQTYNDHRMAMAACILASFLNGGVVKGIGAIQKSYPNFLHDFEKLGGHYFKTTSFNKDIEI